MSHIVIVHSTDAKSFYPCDDIESAVATIERFRNEENVESCELFELHPISFEFKPYYHVAFSTGAPSTEAGFSSEKPGGLASNLSSLSEAPAAVAPESELNVPVLAAVESPSVFDTAAPEAAPIPPLSEAFAVRDPEATPAFDAAPVASSPFGFADEAPAAPSALDATLANVGVPVNPPIPPVPPAPVMTEAIPPAPVFGEVLTDPMSAAPAIDPFAQSPTDAAAVATGATSGFGFELGSEKPAAGFDPVLGEDSAASSVTDLFDSSAELPPPPPPPPLETEAVEEPRRGLFGR